MDIVEKARIFARAAHAAVGQRRKYTGEEYIYHPLEVATIVQGASGDVNMIAAAILHDVIEDTQVTEEILREEFGDDITELVGWLTDVSKPEDGNRAARKAIDREHSAMAPARAQTIKCFDLWSNTRSITEHDKDFAKVYLKEKRLLLEVLIKADPTARQAAYDSLLAGERDLQFSK